MLISEDTLATLVRALRQCTDAVSATPIIDITHRLVIFLFFSQSYCKL